MITMRRLSRDSPAGNDRSLPATVLGNGLAFVATLPLALPVAAVRTADIAAILYLGVIQIGLAYWLFSKGLKRLPALEVSLLVLLEPVLNPLWTWLTAGERPSALASAGGAIMIVALAAQVLTQRGAPAGGRRRRRRFPTEAALERHRALAELRARQPGVEQHRMSRPRPDPGLREGRSDLVGMVDRQPLAAERLRREVVVGRGEDGPDVVAQHRDLVARDLRPRGVVADQSDHRHAVADEGVELHQAVGDRTVAVEDPDLRVGPRDLGAEREAAADTERAEDARIEPAEGRAGAHDVRRRADEVAAVGDQDRIVVEEVVELAQEAAAG